MNENVLKLLKTSVWRVRMVQWEAKGEMYDVSKENAG